MVVRTPTSHAPARYIGPMVGAAAAATLAVRIVIGIFVLNDWEGWTSFLENAVAMTVEAVVLGLLFFFVARAVARRGHAAVGACVLGVLGVISFAVPYSAFQVIIGAAAVALALADHDRLGTWRRPAAIGGALGIAVVTCWLAFVLVAVVTGEWPVNY